MTLGPGCPSCPDLTGQCPDLWISSNIPPTPSRDSPSLRVPSLAHTPKTESHKKLGEPELGSEGEERWRLVGWLEVAFGRALTLERGDN